MKKSAWVFILGVACADKTPPPAPAPTAPEGPVGGSAPAQQGPLVEPASPEACKKAEKLRRTGFNKLLDLELEGAKADFNAVLRLDPGDVGAMHQLAVIEALEQGKQVGTSEANSSLRSQVTPSRCKVANAEAPKGKWVARSDSGAVLMSTSAKHEAPPHREGVQAVMQKALLQMSSCADKAGLSTRAASIAIKFTIDRDGNVANPELSGAAEALTTCVREVVKALRFAARDIPVDVSYPVDFSR